MPAYGTKRTEQAGWLMSVDEGKPEVAGERQIGAFDPNRTSPQSKLPERVV
jgi:hypothetical protein